MENATKALIIAGSILIAILLIAMGMRVFNSTSGTADSVEGAMNTVEIANYNSKFTIYQGKQSGSKVKTLANLVIAHNANSTKKVTFNLLSDNTAILNQVANIDIGKKYTVEVKDSNSDGYVDQILFY